MESPNQKASRDPERPIFRTLREDLQQPGLRRSVERDLFELQEILLTEDRQRRLRGMHRIARWFTLSWWLLRSMILHLSPARRLFVVVGIVFLCLSAESAAREQGVHLLGGAALVLVIMLELKDKLLARRELEAGHAVQRALMPERSPAVPGWRLWLFTRPANDVGGDLVDCIPLGGGHYGLAVADVAGKGLRAALVTSKLQATLRALLPETTSVAELGMRINRILRRDGIPGMFASLVFLDVRADSPHVTALNAGHLPPILVRRGAVTPLVKHGPALGLTDSAVYAAEELELAPGDVLLVYSDGLTEARSPSGEEFGEERLRHLMTEVQSLPPTEIGERLVSEVDRFIGEARPHDDLSFLVLARAPLP